MMVATNASILCFSVTATSAAPKAGPGCGHRSPQSHRARVSSVSADKCALSPFQESSAHCSANVRSDGLFGPLPHLDG